MIRNTAIRNSSRYSVEINGMMMMTLVLERWWKGIQPSDRPQLRLLHSRVSSFSPFPSWYAIKYKHWYIYVLWNIVFFCTETGSTVVFPILCLNYQTIVRQLSDNCQAIVGQLSDNYQIIVRQLSDNYQTIVRQVVLITPTGCELCYALLTNERWWE